MRKINPRKKPIMSDTSVRHAIEQISAVIAAQPEKARARSAPATAHFVDGLQCRISGPHGESLTTDMPPAMGGNASGPNPGWLLRGALASCTATVIAMRAAKLGVVLNTLEVTVESESDNRGILASTACQRVRQCGPVDRAPEATPEQLRNVKWADAPWLVARSGIRPA